MEVILGRYEIYKAVVIICFSNSMRYHSRLRKNIRCLGWPSCRPPGSLVGGPPVAHSNYLMVVLQLNIHRQALEIHHHLQILCSINYVTVWCKARFMVSPEGLIKGWSHEGNDCKECSEGVELCW